ncbi:hypothetical protein HMPREF9144_2754 [Prevotella pallens ATCC 700821]|uniref:Uncharacterized protein n=1 Tax=Prevotella pallens ATCC 700821 TaxID=997353 RepID=F9DM62_9BACT|nr:hypothetical protein HMPREF9144_2754 [Prevotella pallens ATCC 700821]
MFATNKKKLFFINFYHLYFFFLIKYLSANRKKGVHLQPEKIIYKQTKY